MLKVYDVRKNGDVPILREKQALPECGSLTGPQAITKIMNDIFDAENLCEEYVWIIAFNTKMKPVGIFEVSHGTVNSSFVSTSAVMMRLCLCGAVCFVVTHNHPSGDVNPSNEDINVTEKMKNAGELLDIKMQDHIIIGSDGQYYSFQESGGI